MSGQNSVIRGEEYDIQVQHNSIGEFIFEMCDKYASKTFHIFVDTNEKETFASVKERSIKLAIELQNLGTTPEDKIMVCSTNHLHNIIPIVATQFIGAKLSSLHSEMSAMEAIYLFNLVQPKMVFVEEAVVTFIEKVLEQYENKIEIVVLGKSQKYKTLSDMTENVSSKENTFRPVKVKPTDVAFIFFSSGSTGTPKGICSSHYSLLYILEIMMKTNGIRKFEGVLTMDTTYWATEVYLYLMTFHSGGYRVLTRNLDIENIFQLIQDYKASVALFPATWTYLITEMKNIDKYDLSNLDTAYTVGSSLPSDHILELRKKLPHTFLSFFYGQTEIHQLLRFDIGRHKDLYEKNPGSVGKLVCGAEVKVVDLETNLPVGANQKGEMRVKTKGMMNGYYNSDSSDVFDEEGYYKSGDIVYYNEDECFYIVNRIKNMIKFQDWHVMPFFIEEVIMKHPAVYAAVVFGIPDEIDGDLPAAVVILKNGVHVNEIDILNFVNERVSDKEKLRGGLKIVKNIPKTPTGKFITSKAKEIFLSI